MSAPTARARHVDVVDGLRGLAILLVLAFHYWQLSFWAIRLPGGVDLEFVQFAGYLGVELFFFLSALCLFLPHAKAMSGLGPVPTPAPLRLPAGDQDRAVVPAWPWPSWGGCSPISTPSGWGSACPPTSRCT